MIHLMLFRSLFNITIHDKIKYIFDTKLIIIIFIKLIHISIIKIFNVRPLFIDL